MTLRKTWWAIAAVTLALAASTAAGSRDPALAGYFSAPVRIVSGGQRHEFIAYLAVTESQRARGLMFVRDLPPGHGMLFLWEQPWQAKMWMKNTHIPLDMLFIRADGTIANIVTDTEPESLASISATEPVTGVLELNAGTAERLQLEAGDRVVYRAFRAAAATDSGS